LGSSGTLEPAREGMTISTFLKFNFDIFPEFDRLKAKKCDSSTWEGFFL
jgi:hypothetical protein